MFPLGAAGTGPGAEMVAADREMAYPVLMSELLPVGVLGMPGMTAYVGLLDIGRPKAGETVAVSAAAVLDELASVTATPVTDLHVVGGGARMAFMNQLLADHAGVPITVGSPEATALGNAAVQGLALGRFGALDDARAWIGAGAPRLEPGGGSSARGTGGKVTMG